MLWFWPFLSLPNQWFFIPAYTPCLLHPRLFSVLVSPIFIFLSQFPSLATTACYAYLSPLLLTRHSDSHHPFTTSLLITNPKATCSPMYSSNHSHQLFCFSLLLSPHLLQNPSSLDCCLDLCSLLELSLTLSLSSSSRH